MYVIKLNKTEQLYKISTVNVQTNKNELLWYMFMWPPVYIKYTHLSLSYCLGVFQVYNRWCVCVCVCVYGGRVLKSLSLCQIGYNSVEFKTEEKDGYPRNLQISCMKSDMYVHVSLKIHGLFHERYIPCTERFGMFLR